MIVCLCYPLSWIKNPKPHPCCVELCWQGYLKFINIERVKFPNCTRFATADCSILRWTAREMFIGYTCFLVRLVGFNFDKRRQAAFSRQWENEKIKRRKGYCRTLINSSPTSAMKKWAEINTDTHPLIWAKQYAILLLSKESCNHGSHMRELNSGNQVTFH